ncbi:hypothetical protein [Acidovorax sp. BL-A-41-H1]|uniref:hypothetical protein n=1 Tax=Acidovorax sp. BL-A-41-H1 TaxID=3421102 RepID=UPI003F7A00D7
MRRGILAVGLATVHLLAQATDAVMVGCKSVQITLDERVNTAELNRLWASGEAVAASPAVLQLRSCEGKVLDAVTLEGPLAKLDPAALRGAPHPTVLVTVDLTAAAGSYNGPLTRPFEIQGNQLQPVQARAQKGDIEAILLPLTGKAAWKKWRVGGKDQLLAVRSQATDGDFVISYRRYLPQSGGWRFVERSQPGLWESDGEFPSRKSFP